MEKQKGVVFEFYRGTTHDGPGLRTTAFFKGCPLKCAWCHNPESINRNIDVWWNSNKCIGCKLCTINCEDNSIQYTEKGVVIDKSKKVSFDKAVNNCPSKALQFIGKEYTTEQLVKEVLKDDMFFDCFSGGVTISGGEPTLQLDFLLDVLKDLKNKGKNTAVDTCGFCKFESLASIAHYTDTFLYDIKFINKELHHKFTGVNNELILNNFVKLVEYINFNNLPCNIWVRTPVIPNATDSVENIEAIAQFLLNYKDNISRYELCAFNNVCKNKYVKLNTTWKYANTQLMNEQSVNKLKQIATSYLGELVIASGLTSQN